MNSKNIMKRIIIYSIIFCMFLSLLTVAVSAAPAFTDVKSDAWYAPQVRAVVEKGWMQGMGENRFAPDANVTRAMFAQILSNLDGGKRETPKTSPFSDVPVSQWYAAAVVWAAEKNLIYGYGDGKFGANDNITRQDAAVLLYRYMNYRQCRVESGANAAKFNDDARISDYAKTAVYVCAKMGLISGFPDGGFKPNEKITRAQLASILGRMLEKGVLDAASAPKTEESTAPSAPNVPNVPDTPSVPSTPNIPNVPDAPPDEIPDEPELPEDPTDPVEPVDPPVQPDPGELELPGAPL